MQLNFIMDGNARTEIWELEPGALPKQKAFPLEPICVYVRKDNRTSETGNEVRFWDHRHIAKEAFSKQNILTSVQFEEVDWRQVFGTIHGLP